MRGLIMEMPLLILSIIEHAAATHGASEIVSRTIDGGVHRYTYANARARAKRGMRRVSETMSRASARPWIRSSLNIVSSAR